MVGKKIPRVDADVTAGRGEKLESHVPIKCVTLPSLQEILRGFLLTVSSQGKLRILQKLWGLIIMQEGWMGGPIEIAEFCIHRKTIGGVSFNHKSQY